jgi:hypothetical protein
MAFATHLRLSRPAMAVVAALAAAALACANTGSHSLSDGGAGTAGGEPAGGMMFSSDAGAGRSAQGIPGVALAPLDTTVIVTITDGQVTAPTVQFTAERGPPGRRRLERRPRRDRHDYVLGPLHADRDDRRHRGRHRGARQRPSVDDDLCDPQAH